MLHDAIAFWPAALQSAPGPLTLEWALLLALAALAVGLVPIPVLDFLGRGLPPGMAP